MVKNDNKERFHYCKKQNQKTEKNIKEKTVNAVLQQTNSNFKKKISMKKIKPYGNLCVDHKIQKRGRERIGKS